MKLLKLLLITAVLLGFGLTACSSRTDPEAENTGESAGQEPRLIMFYTDN